MQKGDSEEVMQNTALGQGEREPRPREHRLRLPWRKFSPMEVVTELSLVTEEKVIFQTKAFVRCTS